jgi:endonuclease IV
MDLSKVTLQWFKKQCKKQKITGYSTLRTKHLNALIKHSPDTFTGSQDAMTLASDAVLAAHTCFKKVVDDAAELTGVLGGLAIDGDDEPVEDLPGPPMGDRDPTIGKHVFTRGNLAESVTADIATFALDAVQVFTHGPKSYKKIDHDYDAVRIASRGTELTVHSSYLTDIWKNTAQLNNHALDQFDSCAKLGGKGVVLHIPKAEPEYIAEGVKRFSDMMDTRIAIIRQKIILEMKALKRHATKSYESPAKLNRLIGLLTDLGLTPDRVGICIDTAHIYAGFAQIRTYADAMTYLNELPAEWLCLFHINGNEYLNTKKARDKHAVPLADADFIWKGMKYADSGCRAFIEFARAHGIKFIVEIKDHHTDEELTEFIDRMME